MQLNITMTAAAAELTDMATGFSEVGDIVATASSRAAPHRRPGPVHGTRSRWEEHRGDYVTAYLRRPDPLGPALAQHPRRSLRHRRRRRHRRQTGGRPRARRAT